MKSRRRLTCRTLSASSPAWGRGLKFGNTKGTLQRNIVVPRVGTWVEINVSPIMPTLVLVVPRVGTWVEIFTASPTLSMLNSRPPRGDVG